MPIRTRSSKVRATIPIPMPITDAPIESESDHFFNLKSA